MVDRHNIPKFRYSFLKSDKPCQNLLTFLQIPTQNKSCYIQIMDSISICLVSKENIVSLYFFHFYCLLLTGKILCSQYKNIIDKSC